MTIYPANEVRRDGTFTERHTLGGQAYRKFHELELQVGTETARATFDGLHPFVANTYGDKVPIIGVSVNSKTGSVGTASGGVDSNRALSNYLRGKGPAPAGVRSLTMKAQTSPISANGTTGASPISANETTGASGPARPTPFMLTTLKSLAPREAASHMQASMKQALKQDDRSDLAPWKMFDAAIAMIDSLPGDFHAVETERGIVLKKITPKGTADITYLPGDGLALRVESYATNKGYAVSMRRGGTEGSANIMAASLEPEPTGDPHRFVPMVKDVQVVKNAGEFLNVFGL